MNLSKIHESICAEQVVEYTVRPRLFFFDEANKIKLYQGDSLEILRNVPDKCIDLIFADPPYFGNQSGLEMRRTDGHSKTFDTKSGLGNQQVDRISV
jgi:DNA modification methylase